MRKVYVGRTKWILTLFLVFGLVWPCAWVEAATQSRADLEKELKTLNEQSRAFTESFSKVIKYAMPAVVSLSTTRKVKRKVLGSPFDMDDFFRFRDPLRDRSLPTPERRSPSREREYTLPGLGSGFVIDAEKGYIVTNFHVVRDVKAEDIKVTFHDGREAVAEKVLRDEKTEVALIKVKPEKLVALKWGNSEDLRVGQWVIAIGSPLGFGYTATSGIVSATSTKSRRFLGGQRYDLHAIDNPYAVEDYVQTDAAINPGNSGGPLIDLSGRVIGINTLIVSGTGTSAGLGFAVPAKIAGPVVEQLLAKGHVTRGHLGVVITTPAELTDMAAWKLLQMHTAEEALDVYHIKKDDKGVLVLDVLPDSPAEKAKIRPGDLVIEMNKEPTLSTDKLRHLVASAKPGTKIELKARRKGRLENITVTLGEQPSGEGITMASVGKAYTSKDLGLTVQTLTDDMRKGLGYDEDITGVIVTDVKAKSPADKAQLKRNDIIMQVALKDVTNVEEFARLTRDIGKQGVTLLVKSGDKPPEFRALKP